LDLDLQETTLTAVVLRVGRCCFSTTVQSGTSNCDRLRVTCAVWMTRIGIGPSRRCQSTSSRLHTHTHTHIVEK